MTEDEKQILMEKIHKLQLQVTELGKELWGLELDINSLSSNKDIKQEKI